MDAEIVQPPGSEKNKGVPPTQSYFLDPLLFSLQKKWLITLTSACTTLTVTFGSSVFSSTIATTSREFGVSETVMILGVSFYVLGFAVGPIVWGPLSEVKGRKAPLLGGFLAFTVLQIPIGLSKSLAAILACRFLAGAFGAAPLVLVSAINADIWNPADRGTAIAVYAAAVYAGPTLGPVIGSFLTESHLGWRWTAWITLIMAVVAGIGTLLLVPETYSPVLRQRVAVTQHDMGRCVSTPITTKLGPLHDINLVRVLFKKPLLMLVYEPILVIVTLYVSIVYSILYLTLYAYPLSFTGVRGWGPRIGSLPFLSILVGVLIGSMCLAIYSQQYYHRRLLRGKGCAEDRLPPMAVGSILLPVGLFWFAWTSFPDISSAPQITSGLFVGAGIMLIFTSGVAYIIDVYPTSAASAMAANTFVRSSVAAGFPLAAPSMYKMLGVTWATSLLGFFSLALMPAPILFYVFGPRLRRISEYSQS